MIGLCLISVYVWCVDNQDMFSTSANIALMSLLELQRLKP
ncbi:hypothetical protein MC7420_4595 [Coleofasciculus chthonoplastes PCC 7420]|uniref:Uncharacterized protein n=1 Tax=Coleofasciculus chthonoplastes PCC 7420 TaxID=118168 RepID=B4VNY1_9CYAN|nr:hypothetical protein MC7420_4595 [Coleofasciculus chthonoplastes PCC 7420]